MTPAQIGMAHLLGQHLPIEPPGELPDRIRSGREFLVQITGRDFGYRALAWHEYLWDSDAGGYRWARRSRDKWARQVGAAVSDPGWQQAVRELEADVSSGLRSDP